MNESQADERKQHEAAVARLQREHRRLEERMEAMYVDKLDGKIAPEFFERKTAEWRAQRDDMQLQIEEHRTSETSSTVDVRRLAKRAKELFQAQPAREKRKLLDYVVSACTWKDRSLKPEWRVAI